MLRASQKVKEKRKLEPKDASEARADLKAARVEDEGQEEGTLQPKPFQKQGERRGKGSGGEESLRKASAGKASVPGGAASSSGSQSSTGRGEKAGEQSSETLFSKAREQGQALVQEIRVRAHASHSVVGNEHFAWCSTCGSVTTLGGGGKLCKLSKKCEPAQARGKQNLAALRRGENPFSKPRAQAK